MIQIINGVYGYYDGKRVIPKTAEDESFCLPDKDEMRLVRLGIAKYVNVPQEENNSLSVEIKPAYSTDMRLDELKRIALEGYGIDVSKVTSKSKVIELINAAISQQKQDDNNDDDPDGDNDDEPPVLGVAPPVGDSDA